MIFFFQIFTHGSDLQSLHRYIPKEILPAEYGGRQSNFDNTEWREQIIKDDKYFVRLETYNMCDEKLPNNDLAV